MATTPPAQADIDAWFQAAVINGAVNQVSESAGSLASFWVAAYTQDNGDAEYVTINDPTQDPDSATTCIGLVQQYGAITVKAYAFTVSVTAPAAADAALADAVQAALNDSANWVTE